MDNLQTRIIDLTVEQLLELLDKRYGNIQVKDAVPTPSQYLDIQQCAELTGYSEGYLRQLVHKRKVPFHKKPGFKPVRFLRSEINEWLEGKKYTPIEEMADNYIYMSQTKKR